MRVVLNRGKFSFVQAVGQVIGSGSSTQSTDQLLAGIGKNELPRYSEVQISEVRKSEGNLGKTMWAR